MRLLRPFVFLTLLFSFQAILAQTFDSTSYLHLLLADRNEFISYSKSVGLTTRIDTSMSSVVAKDNNCVYIKPLKEKDNNSKMYDLVMVISTPDRTKNRFILRNAKVMTDLKNAWTDDNYLYMESEDKDSAKDVWYRIVIMKKK